MSFPPAIFAIMILGALVLLVGVVVVNVAVAQMAQYLNDKIRGAERRWWSSMGHGSGLVIKEYKQFVWQDKQPEDRLRLGYRMIAIGLVTLFGASVVGQVLRGKG